MHDHADFVDHLMIASGVNGLKIIWLLGTNGLDMGFPRAREFHSK